MEVFLLIRFHLPHLHLCFILKLFFYDEESFVCMQDKQTILFDCGFCVLRWGVPQSCVEEIPHKCVIAINRKLYTFVELILIKSDCVKQLLSLLIWYYMLLISLLVDYFRRTYSIINVFASIGSQLFGFCLHLLEYFQFEWGILHFSFLFQLFLAGCCSVVVVVVVYVKKYQILPSPSRYKALCWKEIAGTLFDSATAS